MSIVYFNCESISHQGKCLVTDRWPACRVIRQAEEHVIGQVRCSIGYVAGVARAQTPRSAKHLEVSERCVAVTLAVKLAALATLDDMQRDIHSKPSFQNKSLL